MYRAVPSVSHTFANSVKASYLRSSRPLVLATFNSCRCLSTSTKSYNQSTLRSGKVDESAAKGVEGPHYADATTVVKHEHDLHTTGEIRGDWVLFHPVYSSNELKAIEPSVHYEGKTFADRWAHGLVRIARRCFDLVSGYKNKQIPVGSTMSVAELRKEGYLMTEKGWLHRIIFLETIAGIPGMVAATIRHLHSLRLLRRDAGWIHTLLEEAENERMHLMTFLAIKKPGLLMRAIILGAQGVFYNVFFLSYLVSPRICHRFVGYLEEEAVHTYSKLIHEIETGKFPEWADKQAPEIAKDYWRLSKDASYLDMIYAVRSDEATHRFVNHSLANLKKGDVNPFAIREPDMTVKGMKYGFERDEAAQYVEESHKLLTSGKTSGAV
ncbi:alternative oxidase [Pyrrhoderma noxium]|uniref:Alternative oxidase n=1 Tax=Pyrrhoderma noxium TaxID=2282107 RepID=A0A286UCG3_9AGAM|nr:alternative oxidase [Pyrrhoderma noxium]